MNELWSNIRVVMGMRHKNQIAKLLFLMVAGACLEVLGVSAILPAVSSILDKDFMNTNKYADAVCTVLGIHTHQGFVMICLLILLLVFAVKNTVLLVRTRYHADFVLEFQYEIRKQATHNYLKKDYAFYFTNNSSEVFKTLMDDVGKVYATFDSILNILTDGIICLFLFIAVFVIDWRISLMVFSLTLVVFLLLTKAVRPAIRKSGKVSYGAQSIRNRWVHQALTGIKTVKITRSEKFFEDRAYSSDLEYSEAEKKFLVLKDIPKMILEMFIVIVMVAMVVMIAASGNNYEVIIPQMGAIGVAILKLVPGINSIISNVIGIHFRTPAIQRVAGILGEKESTEPAGEFPETYRKGIEVQGVSFRYDEGSRYILKDTGLFIPVGKMVGIKGPSGEGKTTFADIMLGLLRPEEGCVLVDGTDIYQNLEMWQKSIGYVTQNVFLLDDSVKSNIAFGVNDEDVDEDLLWESMKKAQIDEFIKTLPDGVDTRVGERGVKFSVGQCQRIGIARALYEKSQILIFDEATSALDADTAAAVIESINELYGKHTIIVISHHENALEHCDIVYTISDGSVYGQSTSDGHGLEPLKYYFNCY